MKKFLAILMAMAIAVTAVSCASAPSGADKSGADSKQIPVKVSLSVPQGHESYIRVEELVAKVNADCGNAFDFKLYGSDSLGDWALVSEEIVRGNVEMLVSSFEANDVRGDFLWAPYLSLGLEDARTVFAEDGYIYNTIESIYDDAGAVFLGFEIIGMTGLSFGRRAPANPIALGGGEGVLMRTAGEEHTRLLMQGMGYNPTTVPWAEVYSSIQTGVIDGFNGAVPSIAYQQYRDVIKTYADCSLQAEVQPICVSKKFWNQLTEEQEKSFRTHAAELFNDSIDQTQASDADYLDKLEESGVQVIRATEEEIQALADYTRVNCWACLEESMGTELYQGLLESYDLAG